MAQPLKNKSVFKDLKGIFASNSRPLPGMLQKKEALCFFKCADP